MHEPGPRFERPRFRVRNEMLGVARGLMSLPRLLARQRALPRGHGQPVLVLPGFGTSDSSTLVLRRFLSGLGYAVHGWELGRNHGRLEQLMPGVHARVTSLTQRSAQPLRLVGWSLGGVIARESARAQPDAVASILTMGTPVIGGPKYTATAKHYLERGVDLDTIAARVAERNARAIAAPITCIYSKRDAVVAWEACLDPNPANRVEYIEVDLAHAELGFSREVFVHIAEHLAREPVKAP